MPDLPPQLVDDLLRAFPQSTAPIRQLATLLHEQPLREPAFDDFGSALRELAAVSLEDPRADFTEDTEGELVPQADPLMLFEDTTSVCGEFADALQDVRDSSGEKRKPERHEFPRPGVTAEAPSTAGTLHEFHAAGPRPAHPLSPRLTQPGTVAKAGPTGDQRLAQDWNKLWLGAHELLRQVVYHVLRRRAGLVGQLGLGPCVRGLASAAGNLRIHLVGHGLGGRLAGFTLRGLEHSGEPSPSVQSLTLLQAAISHFAFASSLPHQVSGHGALWDRQRLVRGAVVTCFSDADISLGLMHPLATQMVGDAAELSTVGRKWGAAGFDGLHGVDGPPALRLNDVLADGLPSASFVNIDAGSVVRDGPVPTGAHHDVLHPEVARLLLHHIPR
ncbi:hypothetical protein [Streptomyces sp. YIM 130001]|uniref:hypothetical protein n=1 Tax=Streptomyces sp. YIM 130001 TaxID=2259644 RepID=UPI000E655A37|nr:hypothetical protein [Streptomyces sp. YIM 130001]